MHLLTILPRANFIWTALLIVIITGFSAASVPSSAQIVYTDLEPDVTLTATTDDLSVRYDMDLDGDGTFDFYFKHFHPFDDFQAAEVYTSIGRSAEILIDPDGTPVLLNSGDDISDARMTWYNTATQISSEALFLYGDWPGVDDAYLGLRFRKAAAWHYAWIRVAIPADTSSISIKDFAFQNQAGTMIRAGSGRTTDVATTKPQQAWHSVQQGNSLMIQFGGGEWQGARMTLHDLTGRLLLSRRIVRPEEIVLLPQQHCLLTLATGKIRRTALLVP